MSCQRGCMIVERYPGKWYCAVAMEEYDFDFRHYTVYGPKPTEDEVFEEMHRHESNPGGGSTVSYENLTPDDIKLIDRKIK